jgi:hypothetical protein
MISSNQILFDILVKFYCLRWDFVCAVPAVSSFEIQIFTPDPTQDTQSKSPDGVFLNSRDFKSFFYTPGSFPSVVRQGLWRDYSYRLWWLLSDSLFWSWIRSVRTDSRYCSRTLFWALQMKESSLICRDELMSQVRQKMTNDGRHPLLIYMYVWDLTINWRKSQLTESGINNQSIITGRYAVIAPGMMLLTAKQSNGLSMLWDESLLQNHSNMLWRISVHLAWLGRARAQGRFNRKRNYFIFQTARLRVYSKYQSIRNWHPLMLSQQGYEVIIDSLVMSLGRADWIVLTTMKWQMMFVWVRWTKWLSHEFEKANDGAIWLPQSQCRLIFVQLLPSTEQSTIHALVWQSRVVNWDDSSLTSPNCPLRSAAIRTGWYGSVAFNAISTVLLP